MKRTLFKQTTKKAIAILIIAVFPFTSVIFDLLSSGVVAAFTQSPPVKITDNINIRDIIHVMIFFITSPPFYFINPKYTLPVLKKD